MFMADAVLTSTQPDQPTRLEVKLDRPVVSARAFVEKAAALLDLVNSVALTMKGGGGNPPQWVVRELRMGSAVLIAERDTEDRAWDELMVSRAVATARTGLLQLAKPDGIRPPFFNQVALKNAQKLGTPVRKQRAGSLALVMGGARIEPSPFIAIRVAQIKIARLQSLGSIEGKLVDLSSRDGYTIAITDRRGHETRCVFREEMKPKVRELFDEQVRARGVLWSRDDGTRVELELKHIEPLITGAEDLPNALEVRGILTRRLRATE